MNENIYNIKIIKKTSCDFEYNVQNGIFLQVSKDDECEIVTIENYGKSGCNQCVVTVKCGMKSFAFLPCAVNSKSPIFIPDFCIITDAEECRSFDEITKSIRLKGLLTDTERIERAKQKTFSDVKKLRWQKCPTFLSVFGNVNIWEVGFKGFLTEEKQHYELYDYFVPRQNWTKMSFDIDAENVIYRYAMGRGMGADCSTKRKNYKGIYPSLCAEHTDNGVVYSMQAFCDSKEKNIEDDKGTHYLNADLHSAAFVLSDSQREKAVEKENSQDTVLRVKIRAKNSGRTSRLAYIRLPQINTPVMAEANRLDERIENGKGFYKDKIYMLCSLESGNPDSAELTYFLGPEQSVEISIILFHTPVKKEEAENFKASDFDKRLNLCEKYWKKRLGYLKDWHLPEKIIDESVKTGYFHLLQSCYGEKGSDTFAPAVGVYPPIGSESSPILQFFDSVGDYVTAGKGLNYFFDKERENGFIQNITGYMLENGATLYNAGLHFEYSKDVRWLDRNIEKIEKATEYIIEWIERNRVSDSAGYGMIDGQVADPEDTFRSYALNAFAYAGLKKSAMLYKIKNLNFGRISDYAETLKNDIRKAFGLALRRSPLVPLKNGEWVPAVAPWAEGEGACALHLDGNVCYTHSSHVLKDSLLSLPFLIYYGVFGYEEKETDLIINYIADSYLWENTAYSQPYYSLLPLINLKRGEINNFLSEYYIAFATMADRETHSFWEHFFLATPHKTHEQAWFLMRTRFMLYEEDGGVLNLLKGVPEKWKKKGKYIRLKNACCQFGKFSLNAVYGEKECTVEFDCDFDCDSIIYGKEGKQKQTRMKKGKNIFTV